MRVRVEVHFPEKPELSFFVDSDLAPELVQTMTGALSPPAIPSWILQRVDGFLCSLALECSANQLSREKGVTKQ